MANEIIRMNRIRDLLKEVPCEKRKVLRHVFVAKMSLKYGISIRTLEDYMKTLIDAGEVVWDPKNMVWKDV